MRIRLSEELYLAQLQRLRKGEVDIAIGGVDPTLSPGEFVSDPLVETTMVVVVHRDSPRRQARCLAELADAQWIYTGASGEQGYARTLFAAHGLPAPPLGAVVNSTLALLSVLTAGDFVGLMPAPVAGHPLAAQCLAVVPLREEGLPVTVAAFTRRDTAVAPAVRHFIAHLHRAAHQLQPAPA
jgi:DNA-binding transcriptional LysR family regulator